MDVITAPSLPPLGADPAHLAVALRSGDPRAAKAVAAGFEGMFASILIKQMRQTLEEDGLFSGDKSDILGGLFDYTLGQHIARTGALGIGGLIERHLAQTQTAQGNDAPRQEP